MDLKALTIESAAELLKKGELSAVGLTESALKAVKEKDGELHAFLSVFEKEAAEAAKAADQRIKNNEAGPLTGIPIAVKDNILVRGEKATAGSRILESYRAAYDATAVKKLKEAGAVILGKTNLDEFGMGSSTENSAYGPTKNPHDQERVPGGSSGGSAAAVAAGMCLGALGSDTGGSVREPASFCGIVGLKPTYGAVSRHGLIALASSLDQIGPITKTVRDARIIFNVIRGQDPLDATTIPGTTSAKKFDIKKFTVGVPREYFEAEGLDARVKEIVLGTIKKYESRGAEIKEISLPSSHYGLATYYILMPAEASTNLARYDGVRYGHSAAKNDLWGRYESSRAEGFGSEPIRRVMIGTYVLSAGYYDAYYKKAKAAQVLIQREFEAAFKKVDVIMTPTAPTTAFKIGEKTQDPLQMYAADIFTVPVNIAGLPAISIPCGEIAGLPVGLQIVAPWREEEILFEIGDLLKENNS